MCRHYKKQSCKQFKCLDVHNPSCTLIQPVLHPFILLGTMSLDDSLDHWANLLILPCRTSPIFWKFGTPLGCIFSIFVLNHTFPNISNMLVYRAATIFVFRWVPSFLSPELASGIIRLGKSECKSWQLKCTSWANLYVFHHPILSLVIFGVDI